MQGGSGYLKNVNCLIFTLKKNITIHPSGGNNIGNLSYFYLNHFILIFLVCLFLMYSEKHVNRL